jgi:hypothetical protein
MVCRTESSRRSLYAGVTERVIAELEEGRLPWVQPWDAAACGCAMPANAVTVRRYSGIRVVSPRFIAACAVTIAACRLPRRPLKELRAAFAPFLLRPLIVGCGRAQQRPGQFLDRQSICTGGNHKLT